MRMRTNKMGTGIDVQAGVMTKAYEKPSRKVKIPSESTTAYSYNIHIFAVCLHVTEQLEVITQGIHECGNEDVWMFL